MIELMHPMVPGLLLSTHGLRPVDRHLEYLSRCVIPLFFFPLFSVSSTGLRVLQGRECASSIPCVCVCVCVCVRFIYLLLAVLGLPCAV